MSEIVVDREQRFAKLFHATAQNFWHRNGNSAGLLDEEARAFLASIDYPEQEFFEFIQDFVGVAGESILWWQKAADDGDLSAQNTLGYLFANGIGVQQDYPQALAWYRKAADRGDRNAQDGLGFLYANGLGTPQDFSASAYWYAKSAAQGSAYGQLYLGLQYHHGQGVPRDDAKAVLWLTKAAEKGSALAIAELKIMGAAAGAGAEPDMKNELSPIFIVGCGHSGTSLLVNVLGAHSRIGAVPFESNFALKWPKPCDAAWAFLQRCDNFTRRMGKARWIEKTPRHIYRVKEILDYFPEAKILLMLRDGRDVAMSIQDRCGNLEAGINRWLEDNRVGRPFWNHPSVQVVRYENLVEQFDGTVRQIFDFVGEKFEESVTRFHETPRYYFVSSIEKPADAFGNNHYGYRNWQMNQPLFDGRGRWHRLSDSEKQLIKDKAGSALIEYGYTMDLDW